jgi:transposase-like protein
MQRFNPIETVFKGRHFDGQIIILCVAWYTSFKLSLRDLVIMMADRGIPVTHTTILRWVQRYLPEFEKRWRRYARPLGGSWRMDETYIKVQGQWVYLYRAVDKAGQTVDFFLSRNRDVNAAKSFLRSAMKNTRVPTKITLDAYAASHGAVREMKEDGELPGRVQVRSSQYLNNLVEQDHRRVKQRIRSMLGFKRFDNAVVTISGIELAEKIKKGQFKTGKLGGCKATMTELWNAEYLIGSSKANRWTGLVMEEFFANRQTKWDFRPDPESKDIRNPKVILRANGKNHSPIGWEETSRVRNDFGIVIRGPNPRDGSLLVMVLAGRSALGTEAACLAVTDPACIRMMKRELEHRRIDLDDHRQPFLALVSVECKNKDAQYETGIDTFKIWEVARC